MPTQMEKVVLYVPDQKEHDFHTSNIANEKPKIIRTKEKRLHEIEYPHIVFIGSGAAVLSPIRSNAAILVNLT